RLQALFDQFRPPIEEAGPSTFMQSRLDAKYLIARLGGDEFAVYVTMADREQDGSMIAKAVLKSLADPFVLSGVDVIVGTSIGLARSPVDGDSYATLIRHADMAMYEAKRAGKNTFRHFDPSIAASINNAAEIRRDIPRALQLDQFELHYQPRFHAASKQVRCMEALLRWNHPKDGQRLPGAFLDAIESTDAIIDIDHWVLRNALAQLTEWSGDHPDLALSINMSTRQLIDSRMADQVIELVHEAGIDPSRIELEVTEHAVLSNEKTARMVIERLHDVGLKIAIDDFGQGYSNYARFAELPVDVIKIDRSLVSKLTEDPRVPMIVRSMITMADGLQCTSVAEGIEELEQVAVLKELGCTEFQGYLFSKPLPAEDAKAWLSRAAAAIAEDGNVTLLRPA
ncbi:MAG: bifunctional diguanylate cyclase/phosphodiesterase, partial [Pseudomonadota bacterium]